MRSYRYYVKLPDRLLTSKAIGLTDITPIGIGQWTFKYTAPIDTAITLLISSLATAITIDYFVAFESNASIDAAVISLRLHHCLPLQHTAPGAAVDHVIRSW